MYSLFMNYFAADNLSTSASSSNKRNLPRYISSISRKIEKSILSTDSLSTMRSYLGIPLRTW